jgi:type I restriction enzyme S subunit
MSDAVTAAQWQLLMTIIDAHIPNAEVWAFGSRMNGRHHRGSDLDVVIISPPILSLAQMAHLREALSESDLPWAVDIVEWGRCSDAFRAIIQAQYQIISPNQAK